MDVQNFINRFEASEGMTVFPDFEDEAFDEAMGQIDAEQRIWRSRNERQVKAAQG